MEAPSQEPSSEPGPDCPLCPRLVAQRMELRGQHPDWWNASVPALGDAHAPIAIVGLAPGKHGANRTGRAFTGDASGDLLFATLAKFGLAEDGEPKGVLILNAVRCLPPGNKPDPLEVRTCRQFLEPQLRAPVTIALGQIAHQSAVKAMGGRLPKAPFGHGNQHRMPDGRILIDSYHCSRYNQNTNRLTAEMFESVFARALELSQLASSGISEVTPRAASTQR